MSFDLLFTPLTDAQVQAGARPGESWEQARDRLECARYASPNASEPAQGEWSIPFAPVSRQAVVSSLSVDVIEPSGQQYRQRPSASKLFDLALEARGQRRPTETEIRSSPHLADLVQVARTWISCAVRLPHEDRYAVLYYMVFTSYCDGWLHCCRFVDGQWQCAAGGSIGSVTHWKLAVEGERASRYATRAELHALRNSPDLR